METDREDFDPLAPLLPVRMMPAADLAALPPLKQALLGPLVPGSIAVIRGPRGVGKSWLALAVAQAIAGGGALFGWRARATPVLYVETAMSGHVASEIWDGEKRFDVTVRLPPSTREDVEAISRISLPMKDGSLLPLSAIATVGMSTGRAAITREDGRRYVGVRMNVRNRDLGSFVQEAQQRVASAVHLPEGYETTWGGEFENQRRAMHRIAIIVPISVFVIFLLLYFVFLWIAWLLAVKITEPKDSKQVAG